MTESPGATGTHGTSKRLWAAVHTMTQVGEARTLRVIQCTRCDAQSSLAPLEAFARWALDHALDTGHRDFRQVFTVDTDPAGTWWT
ncbi:DUF7848 domain-containing protein [Streptomyces yaizuensis]